MLPLDLQKLILEFHDSMNMIEKRKLLHQELRSYFFPGFYHSLVINGTSI